MIISEQHTSGSVLPGTLIGRTGIVIASDGNGNYTVFDPTANDDPTVVIETVTLQLQSPIDYITIELDVSADNRSEQ